MKKHEDPSALIGTSVAADGSTVNEPARHRPLDPLNHKITPNKAPGADVT